MDMVGLNTLIMVIGVAYIVLTCVAVYFAYLCVLYVVATSVEPTYRKCDPRLVWLMVVPGLNVLLHLYLGLCISVSIRRQIRDSGSVIAKQHIDMGLAVAIFVLNVLLALTFLTRGLAPELLAAVPPVVLGGIAFCCVIGTPILVVAHLVETLELAWTARR